MENSIKIYRCGNPYTLILAQLFCQSFVMSWNARWYPLSNVGQGRRQRYQTRAQNVQKYPRLKQYKPRFSSNINRLKTHETGQCSTSGLIMNVNIQLRNFKFKSRVWERSLESLPCARNYIVLAVSGVKEALWRAIRKSGFWSYLKTCFELYSCEK